MAKKSFVDELLDDARRVAEYSAAVSGQLNTTLVTAIDAVDRLPPPQRTLSDPAVTHLIGEYEKLRGQVPFKEFYALRNGWRIFPTKWQRLLTAIMVLAAILFMVCTLHLTRIYNRGVEISASLTALEEGEAEIRYGELERRLLDAQSQLAEAAVMPGQAVADEKKLDTVNQAQNGANAGVEPLLNDDKFVLAREASHRLLNELVNLDQRIGTVNLLAGEFQQQSRYPIIGQQSLEGHVLNLVGMFRALNRLFGVCPYGLKDDKGECIFGGGQAVNNVAATNVRGFDPRLARMRDTFCGKVELLEDYAQGKLTKAELANADTFLGSLAYSINESLGVDTAEAIVRSCALGMNFYSGSFPDIEALNMRVKDTLNLYSLIILPAMFGALGAIVYFLRAFLNPKQPNEGWSRTLYHIALGALAGMVMAWLGMGLLGSDEAFKSIGLGLFAFAFVLGFSIDVFFDMLENLVKAASRAVSQIGSTGSGGSSAGSPPPPPPPPTASATSAATAAATATSTSTTATTPPHHHRQARLAQRARTRASG